MTTAIQPREKLTQLRAFLHAPSVVEQLRLALPKHLTPQRVLRQVMTLVQKTPGLLECSEGSILAGLIQASELGLELSGPLGQAYLVPRYDGNVGRKVACFQVGYRGLIDLAFRSGQVRAFPLVTVREKDYFELHEGSDRRIVHRPELKEDPGEPVGFYAIVKFINGGEDFVYFSRHQVERHRDRYATHKGKASPIWKSNFDEMAEKTVAIQLAHRCPLSVEFQTAAMADVYARAEEDVPALPPPSRAEQLARELDGGEQPVQDGTAGPVEGEVEEETA